MTCDIVNIFAFNMLPSAPALRRSLGLNEKKHPYTCFILDFIYARAYDSEIDPRSREEKRADFAEFRKEMADAVQKARRNSCRFINKNECHDLLLALALGYNELGSMNGNDMSPSLPHLPKMKKVCDESYDLVNGRQVVTQESIDALSVSARFVVLNMLCGHFEACHDEAERHCHKPNEYATQAIRRHFAVFNRFDRLHFGRDRLSQTVEWRLDNIRQSGAKLSPLQTMQPTGI